MEASFFGALWVTQAAIPIMRAQRSGHIIQVSSIGGITAFPGNGAYHASKWGLEGFSQALAQEVADFGIRVTLVEPGKQGRVPLHKCRDRLTCEFTESPVRPGDTR